jgi:hypothetical protein
LSKIFFSEKEHSMKPKLILVLTLIVSLLFVGQARAQSANRLWLSPGEITARPGDIFYLDLNTAISDPGSAINLQLEFDPACLALGTIMSDSLNSMAEIRQDGFLDATFGSLSSGGENTLVGEMTLMSIEFEMIADCPSTSISLAETALVKSLPDGSAAYVQNDLGAPVNISAQSTGIPTSTPDVWPTPTTGTGKGEPTPPPDDDKPEQGVQTKSFSLDPFTAFLGSLAVLGVSGSVVFVTLMQRIWPVSSSRKKQTSLASSISMPPQRPAPAPLQYVDEAPTLFEGSALFSASSLLLLHNGTQTRVSLKASPFNIGRTNNNHLTVNSPNISRLHAQLVQVGSDWYISDNHSRNGTFVNNQRITNACLLQSGDEIRLGQQVVMTFE